MKKNFIRSTVLALCAVLMTPVIGFAGFPMTPMIPDMGGLSRPHDDKLREGDFRKDSSFKNFKNERFFRNERFFDKFDDERFFRNDRFRDFKDDRDDR